MLPIRNTITRVENSFGLRFQMSGVEEKFVETPRQAEDPPPFTNAQMSIVR